MYYINGIMTDISTNVTQNRHSDFHRDKGQDHILLNLQDLVELNSLKNLLHFAR